MHVFSRNGAVTLSPGVREHATVLAEVGKSIMNWTSRHTYFVGPLPEDAAQALDPECPEPWTGDEVRVEAINGSVQLSFVDEEVGTTSKGAVCARVARPLWNGIN